MNWHYIVLIAAVLILFISMGNDPFAPPEGWVPPDEFKDGIKARIDGPPGGFSGGSGIGGGGFGSGGGGFGSSTNGANTMGSGGYGSNMGSGAYKPSYGIGTADGVGTYQPNATNPAYDNNGVAEQGDRFRQLQQKPPAVNSNMPTPFQNLPGTTSPRSDASDLSFPGLYSYRANNGAPIKFTGSSVYTLTKKGETIAMPDGKYNLEDGRTITVRAGKNMFPIGGNEFN